MTKPPPKRIYLTVEPEYGLSLIWSETRAAKTDLEYKLIQRKPRKPAVKDLPAPEDG